MSQTTLTPEAFIQHMKNDLMNDNFSGPTCVAVRGADTILAILDPSMPTLAMRLQAFAVVGARFAESFSHEAGPLDRLMIARETWNSKQCKVAPADDPDRIEGLTISVADFKTVENYVLLFDVVRSGNVIDMVLRKKVPASQTDDKNMKALMTGMIDRIRGKQPDATGLHVHQVDLGKKT